MKLPRFLRQAGLCRHELVFERNLYGSERFDWRHDGKHESLWKCAKCGGFVTKLEKYRKPALEPKP